MQDFTALAKRIQPLLDSLQPSQQRQLMVGLARNMRRQNQQRLRSQKKPDGSNFEPRKPQLRSKQGSIKRQAKMFAKLGTTRFMRIHTSPTHAAIRFTGRVARIAQVHQHGLRDRVSPKGPIYLYPQRQLLGLTQANKQQLISQLLTHLNNQLVKNS